ncbi:TetR/AcrR family transcriptional regulator [Caballeronia sp.]|uniref:TetR/AcrR family transcriptional regulator n=1 Tax=Caballeronia sp. TaxID=1931223 RepID=UPI003C6F51DB
MTVIAQRTPKRHVMRNAILDAARAIMLRDGFDALSMRKIADVIGYSPASLYLHFEGRDAIAHALCGEGHAQLMAALRSVDPAASPASRLTAMGHAYVAFARKHPQIYQLIFMENSAYTAAAMGQGADGATTLSILSDPLTALCTEENRLAAAEILWAALHGIASLSLTASAFIGTPVDALVEHALAPYLPNSDIGKTARRRPNGRSA